LERGGTYFDMIGAPKGVWSRLASVGGIHAPLLCSDHLSRTRSRGTSLLIAAHMALSDVLHYASSIWTCALLVVSAQGIRELIFAVTTDRGVH
jgi:hypothetical protein